MPCWPSTHPLFTPSLHTSSHTPLFIPLSAHIPTLDRLTATVVFVGTMAGALLALYAPATVFQIARSELRKKGFLFPISEPVRATGAEVGTQWSPLM